MLQIALTCTHVELTITGKKKKVLLMQYVIADLKKKKDLQSSDANSMGRSFRSGNKSIFFFCLQMYFLQVPFLCSGGWLAGLPIPATGD